jgi:uncharacterized protein DUF6364
MQTKLTLRLDARLVNKAKAYAKRSGKSVSQMVADFFSMLGSPPEQDEPKWTPTVRSLKGVLRGTGVSIEDYRRHIREKHL